MNTDSTLEELRLLSDAIIESSLAGYWDWNIVSNEEYLSPRFKEMFGYSDDEMENSPEAWQKIAFEEDLPKMFESFEKHVESGGKVPFTSIVRYTHKDGDVVWVRCNGKVIEWGKNGEPLRAIGCHIDITPEKEMEIQLKGAITERDVLLKEVHHRVKNNLQLLLSLARLKDQDGVIETKEIEDSINSISRAYEAIYKTDDINEVSLRQYVQQVMGPLISSQKINLMTEIDAVEKKIDFLIPIGLIITELFNNSMKHGFKEKNNLASVSLVIEENENLILNYSDNGVGYSKEVLKNLYDQDSFGLTIIKGLIEQLNGEINFYNEGGACVKIIIPSRES